MSKHQFDALMNVMDTDHDGKISYEEFMRQVKYCDDLEAEEEELKRVREILKNTHTFTHTHSHTHIHTHTFTHTHTHTHTHPNGHKIVQ